MKIKKAIDLLDNLIGMVEDNQENNYDDALHTAVRSLEALKEAEEKMLYLAASSSGYGTYASGLGDALYIISEKITEIEEGGD